MISIFLILIVSVEGIQKRSFEYYASQGKSDVKKYCEFDELNSYGLSGDAESLS